MALTQISQAGAKDEAVNEAKLQISNAGTNGQFLQKSSNTGGLTWATVSTTPEGTAILSTGESGGSKFLREDGDGTCSWQTVNTTPEGTAILSTGESGGSKYLREDGDGTCSWQSVPAGVGGANTVQFNDDVKATFGTTGTGDLEIYHDGSHSIITNSTGDLSLIGAGDDVFIKAADNVFIRSQGDEKAITCTGDAGVELYYNDVKSFETVSGGIQVSGPEGNPASIYLYADEGDDNEDKYEIKVDASGIFTISNYADGAWEKAIECNHGGNVELYWDNTKKFETTSTGSTLQGNLVLENTDQSKILSHTADGSDDNWLSINGGGDASQTRGGGVTCFGNEVTDNQGKINIAAGNSGSANGTINFSTGGGERVRIDSTGKVGIGDVSPTKTLTVGTTTPSILLDDQSSRTLELVGGSSTTNPTLQTTYNASLYFGTNSTARYYIDTSGHFIPNANDTYDLGSNSNRFRNIHTNDLNLSNEGSTNSVDGTWGSFTIQEGEEDLFLINKRNGKKYKFNLTEVIN